jgi:hypothetical protein
MALSLKLPWSLANTKWAAELNPVLANPQTNMAILKNVALVAGNNAVPHMLQQTQQGWIITDIQGVSSIYRNKPFDKIYLYLNSSAAVIVNIGVF